MRTASPVFTSPNVSRAYFPGRSLLVSILIHGILVLGMFLLPGARRHFAAQERTPEPAKTPDDLEIDPKIVMFLPLLNGADADERRAGDDSAAGHKGALEEPGVKGLSYPGPQPINSNPPKPTNRIQTVLQPELENPPILPPPIPLPNMVQIADAGPASRPELPEPAKKLPDTLSPVDPQTRVPDIPPEVKEAEPAAEPAVMPLPPTTPIESPKMVIPADDALKPHEEQMGPPQPPPAAAPPPRTAKPPASHEVKARQTPAPRPKVPEPPKKQPPLEAPKESLVSRTASARSRGSDRRTLLALSPMPAPRQQPFEVPLGEARGRFAILPEPNLGSGETEPGSKSGPTPPGSGAGNPLAAGKTSAPNAAGGGKDGTGSGSDSTKDKSTNGGNGNGSGTGSGNGSGSGPGKKPFSGITILGGVSGSGAASEASASLPPTPRPLQKAYGVTILSTEASGGGLPFFGVFSSSRIYTVFLDMRKTETEKAPSWPLEYAVPQSKPEQPKSIEDPPNQGLVLPFPAFKERPALPTELVRQYPGRMIVVFAIINTQGKMEQVSIKESPNPELNKPVLDALAKWVFRPAQLDGENVAVELLMGIPLGLSE